MLMSYSSVLFSSNIWVGVLVLAATLSRPERGAFGILAALAALLFARALGYRNDLVQAGYYGYNALLVGLLLAQGTASGLTLVGLVLIAAAATTLLSAALGSALLASGLPVLALPFVLFGTLVGHTPFSPEQPPWLASGGALEPTAAEPLVHLLLRSVGCVVFEPTLAAGVLVLGGLLFWSRIAAAALTLGTLTGLLVAREFVPEDPSVALACAYNAGLTALALGAVFFVPSRASMLIAFGSAVLASWLSIAFLSPLAPVAVPVLAWPFVGVTLLTLRGLNLRAPGRAPLPAPLSAAAPERNLTYAAVTQTRLGWPSPPVFVLPFAGAWTVTQGFGGKFTHQDPWSHALDFEIADSNRFPFAAHGTRLEDYYCFGRPVLAPGFGTVIAVHDGCPDNAPGTQDTSRPWGNAIVIQHGPQLFSVLAHLKRASIRVHVGESVTPGQPLAQCGASGRAPRPHLHFQVQATPALGAPTLAFRLAHYCSGPNGSVRFHRLGVPDEGDTVRAPEPSPILLGFAELAPGRELSLQRADGGMIRFRSELSALGEHSLLDVDRDERLYFIPYPGGVTFTTLVGAPNGPLGALLQAAPSVPCIRENGVRFTEFLPTAVLLPWYLRTPYELTKLIADPCIVRVDSELRHFGDRAKISSRTTVMLLGRAIFRRRSEIEIDRSGLRSLCSFKYAEHALPHLCAERPTLHSVPRLHSEPSGEEACVTFR